MRYVIMMENDGGELDAAVAKTKEEAKALLLKMVEDLAELHDGDVFKVKVEE